MEAASRTGVPRASRAERLLVEVRRDRRPGTVVLALDGELDHDTAEPLRSALKESSGAVRVVVDCSGLRFCDSTGLNVLLRTRLRLLAEGGRVDLAGLRPPVDRIFEITGALRVFRVYEDADAALGDPDTEPRGSDRTGADGGGRGTRRAGGPESPAL
ncbi:STAS domain-containing protein [Streptomyces sp. R-07]|uniref:STAS domain-containing protein n=1 Tax=unclassified Streptomyces TaxID=2593676 RepID=UPI0037D1054C